MMEWDFIEAIMEKMEFSHMWIGSIMRCIKSIKYQWRDLGIFFCGDIK